MKKLLALLLFSVSLLRLCAADIYVDYERGNRKNPGTKAAPLDRFARAIAKAKPGDTIYILPSSKPIRDGLIVRKKKGAPGKPITIDGMNNIFLGSAPLSSKKWKETRPGYFSCKIKIGTNLSNRYFMVRNGKPHRMGRFNKARGSKAYKKVEQLAPGEWTIVRGKKIQGRVYEQEYVLRLPEGAKNPTEAGFEEPVRVSGVNIAKDCHYLTFRNIIVKNFLNDGYNIHGNCRNLRFENIAAIYCGDDGISAHETSQIFVKNFIAIACSTAACHINSAENHHENVYAENILGKDLFFTENTLNTFKNVWIKAHSIDGFLLTSRKNSHMRFSMEHARMINYNPRASFVAASQGKMDALFTDVKIAGYRKVDKNFKVTIVKPAEIEAEINAARKRLFALFNGQIEKALAD